MVSETELNAAIKEADEQLIMLRGGLIDLRGLQAALEKVVALAAPKPKSKSRSDTKSLSEKFIAKRRAKREGPSSW